jgi:hypothetical protein
MASSHFDVGLGFWFVWWFGFGVCLWRCVMAVSEGFFVSIFIFIRVFIWFGSFRLGEVSSGFALKFV